MTATVDRLKGTRFLQLQLFLVLIPVLLFISCSELAQNKQSRETARAVSAQPTKVVPSVALTDLEQEFDQYVTDHLLGGITINKIYEVEELKTTIGHYSTVTQEPAKIDYEGMKGDHLNKYRYQDFDLVFYVVENQREIFAYLRIHDGIETPIGSVGDSIADVEAKFPGKLRKWSDSLYTIAISGRNYLSGISLDVNNGTIQKIMINLGEI